MRKLRRARLVALLATVGLLAAACGSDDVGAGGGEGGRFSVHICEPEHLIPQNTNETCGAEVLNALFTPLVEYDPQTSAQTFEGAMGERSPTSCARTSASPTSTSRASSSPSTSRSSTTRT